MACRGPAQAIRPATDSCGMAPSAIRMVRHQSLVTGVRTYPNAASAGAYSYIAQTPPCQRRHLRTARRVWRTVVLATQTPLIRVLPTPQAAATGVIRFSD